MAAQQPEGPPLKAAGADKKRQDEDGHNWWRKLHRAIPALLAAGLLATFIGVAAIAARDANEPPRLADPSPTEPPALRPDGTYPEQLRGGFDPNARQVGLLALVSPLLTTIVGFYFGQRAGDAQADKATAEKEGALREVTQLVTSHGPVAAGGAPAGGTPQWDLLEQLKARGLART